MLSLTGQHRIFVYNRPTDMRKGFDGLSAIVRNELGADPTDGSLFLFINRARDRMKILYFDGGGFWLYYRLLEVGTFETIHGGDDESCHLRIDATELAMLLSGVPLKVSHRRRKRMQHRAA
jgi:transposase